MTKKEMSMVRNYEWAKARGKSSVLSAYGKPSKAKIAAEKSILAEMETLNGYGYYICGAGSQFFSCGYCYRDGEGNEYLVYHTYANRFEIKLSE